MAPERRLRIEAIFHSALERDPVFRAPFLDGACGQDVWRVRDDRDRRNDRSNRLPHTASSKGWAAAEWAWFTRLRTFACDVRVPQVPGRRYRPQRPLRHGRIPGRCRTCRRNKSALKISTHGRIYSRSGWCFMTWLPARCRFAGKARGRFSIPFSTALLCQPCA